MAVMVQWKISCHSPTKSGKSARSHDVPCLLRLVLGLPMADQGAYGTCNQQIPAPRQAPPPEALQGDLPGGSSLCEAARPWCVEPRALFRAISGRSTGQLVELEFVVLKPSFIAKNPKILNIARYARYNKFRSGCSWEFTPVHKKENKNDLHLMGKQVRNLLELILCTIPGSFHPEIQPL